MKKYAYYLPQFHSIPENDLWWGKNFTEWTNVKKAKPLFKNHLQPKIPLNDYYYDLSNIETLKWQANLADKYTIDGMIFYHYYFTGRKILEKPAELLLKNKEIPMNFFFCWANHDWNRSWQGNKEILIKQTYGEKIDWEKHFQYLLPFFKDSRYQKENNRPLFMVFSSNFDKKNELFNYLNQRCIDNGFDGMCLFERSNSYDIKDIKNQFDNVSKATNYLYIREPELSGTLYLKSIRNIIIYIKTKLKQRYPKVEFKKLISYDGNELFKYMTKNKLNSNVARGLFFEWDNTPRHGKRGYIITPPSKERFIDYMNSIKDISYLFINAWNEWGEGMMLEPSEENSFKYLEWLYEWSINE
jgi:hypothetical protein